MANVIEQRGFFWWLSGSGGKTNSEETSVPGLLTINEEGHIRLNLDGALWYAEPPEPLPWGTPRLLPHGKWITGKLDINTNGEHVLLDGLERTDFLIGDELSRPQSYEAQICLTSDSPFSAFFDLEEFHHLRVELVGLEEWLNLDSILVGYAEFDDEDRADVEVKVKFKNHRFFYMTTEGDLSVESMTMGASVIGFDIPRREARFKQVNWLTYTPFSKSSLESLKYDFTRIEELFALLLGSYFHLDWPILVKAVDDQQSWYRLYFFRGSIPEFKPSPYFLWASFNDLRESLGTLVSSWKAQVEQYGAGYYLYLAALRNPLPYSEHKFVNLIWALESLHKRQKSTDRETPSAIERKTRIQSISETLASVDDDKNLRWFLDRAANYQTGPNLSDRILDSLTKLPIPFEEDALRNFSMRCAQRRNDISHEGGPREYETYREFSEDLSNLTDALSYLYHALILSEIGLDRKVLLNTLTEGGLAEVRITPALRKVGLNISLAVK